MSILVSCANSQKWQPVDYFEYVHKTIEFQNLREHWQRMKDKYWGDWDEKLYKDTEQTKEDKDEKKNKDGADEKH